MARPSLLRIPKPKTFLYLTSLRTGTSLITLTALINKLTGLYGLLALLTGFYLSPLQLSMYLYSIICLILLTLLAPQIRHGPSKPFHILSLAWLYVLDSAVNATYTAAFGFGWFLVLAKNSSDSSDPDASGDVNAPGDRMMKDTAGFTSPQYSGVARVEVDPNTSATSPSQLGDVSASAGPAGAFSNTILQPGSLTSICTILALWALRVYFILVVLAYARACLRQHVVSRAENGADAIGLPPSSEDGDRRSSKPDTDHGGAGLYAEDPFKTDTAAGAGWRGALGRVMVSYGRGFWLGVEEGELDAGQGAVAARGRAFGHRSGMSRDLQLEWERRLAAAAGGGGTISGSVPSTAPASNTKERERRRRAGTDPPVPPTLRPIELGKVRK